MPSYTIKYQHQKNRALSTELDFEASDDEAASELAKIFSPAGYWPEKVTRNEEPPIRFRPELCKQMKLWLDGKSASELLKEIDDGTNQDKQ